MERIGIWCIRILFPDIAKNKFPYKNGSFACSEELFWKASLWMVMRYFNFFCIWSNGPSSNSLNKTSPAVNSLICLSGTTIPVEKGAEAEFYGADLLLSKSQVLHGCHFCVAGTLWISRDPRLSFTEDMWFPRVAQWCWMAECGIFDTGRVGNTSLLFPCQSYSDCHLHYPIPIFLKGCPKQKSVVENSCDVMVVACGVFSAHQLCSNVKDHLW